MSRTINPSVTKVFTYIVNRQHRIRQLIRSVHNSVIFNIIVARTHKYPATFSSYLCIEFLWALFVQTILTNIPLWNISYQIPTNISQVSNDSMIVYYLAHKFAFKKCVLIDWHSSQHKVSPLGWLLLAVNLYQGSFWSTGVTKLDHLGQPLH